MSGYQGGRIFSLSGRFGTTGTCVYLNSSIRRFPNDKIVVRRVLLILTKTECESKTSIANEFLNSKDAVVLSSAINLATSLGKNNRKNFVARIKSIERTNNDSLVQTAVKLFLNSLK